MRTVLRCICLVIILGGAFSDISLKDLLSIDPTKLLTAPKISDDDKRKIIDCLGDNSTDTGCPDVPLTNALKEFRELVKKSKEDDSATTKKPGFSFGIIGAAVDKVKKVATSVLQVGSEPIPGLTEEAQKILTLFEKVKSNYAASQNGLPEDPFQDISDYSKTKGSINVLADVEGALKTRKSLAETFASTKDEVLYKYGSNYDPLILSVSHLGLIRMLVDAL